MGSKNGDAIDLIDRFKPASIFDHVPPECFREYDDPAHAAYIKSENYYEWKYAVAAWAARMHGELRICEVGVRYGYSLLSIAAGALQSGEVHVTGIDNGSYCADWKSATQEAIARFEFHRERRHAMYGDPWPFAEWDLIESDSEKVLELPECDLLHIDGPHYYRETLRLLEMADGVSVILVDDFTSCPDDAKAVRDYCEASGATLIPIESLRGDAVIVPAS